MMLEVDISGLVIRLQKLERLIDSQRLLTLAAKIARGEIRGDAEREKGYDGNRFEPLTEPYGTRKSRAGHGRRPNLRARGLYLDSFYDREESKHTRILSPADSMRPQAEGLSSKRKHIGVSANAKRLIEKDIQIIVEHELQG